jgi:predicted nucleic acid-binding protein
LAYLFDTDAISETLRKRPSPVFADWLRSIPPEEQFTSSVVIGELFKGAFRSPECDRHLTNIQSRVLPALVVLPFDVETARVFGEIHAKLSGRGRLVEDADLQIAATAIHHGLELVTGNLDHFERIPGIRIHRALANARS